MKSDSVVSCRIYSLFISPSSLASIGLVLMPVNRFVVSKYSRCLVVSQWTMFMVEVSQGNIGNYLWFEKYSQRDELSEVYMVS